MAYIGKGTVGDVVSQGPAGTKFITPSQFELLHHVVVNGDYSFGDIPGSEFSFTADPSHVYEVTLYSSVTYNNETDYIVTAIYGQFPGEGSYSIKDRTTSPTHSSLYFSGATTMFLVTGLNGTTSVKANITGSDGVVGVHTFFTVKRIA